MNNAQQVIQACRDLSKAAKSMKFLSGQLLANNNAKKLDLSKQDIIDAEAEGVSPEKVLKTIESLTAYHDEFWPIHGENFENMAPPIV